MRIELNGTTCLTEADTLEALLAERGFEAARVATALDGCFVARTRRAAARLAEGARVEVLAPMQGG